MREFLRQMVDDRKVLVFVASVFLLTLLGPFDTYSELNFFRRFAYWLLIFAGVGVFMNVLFEWFLSRNCLPGVPTPFRITLAATIAALPGAILVYVVDSAFRPGNLAPSEMFRLWAQVSVLGAFILNTVHYLDVGKGSGATLAAQSAPSSAPPRIAFLERVPQELGEDIVSMSMQDHYIEVTTTLGSHLILMRLTDAIREIEGIEGLQTHRSHCVAEKQQRAIGKNGIKWHAVMSDDRHVPVSQTFLKDVRAALSAP